jgi:hypothetical protein
MKLYSLRKKKWVDQEIERMNELGEWNGHDHEITSGHV